jgi:micrococcal nuclease
MNGDVLRAARKARSMLLLTVMAMVCAVVLPMEAQRDIPPSEHRRDLIGKTFEARVVRVGDGDTFDVQLPRESRRLRIRLLGVDAPEQGEVFGRESTTFLRTLLVNHIVRIDGRDMDRYGRLVARVMINGQDASTMLLRAGLACHAYARDAALAREESNARAAGAGFWGKAGPRPRCVSR